MKVMTSKYSANLTETTVIDGKYRLCKLLKVQQGSDHSTYQYECQCQFNCFVDINFRLFPVCDDTMKGGQSLLAKLCEVSFQQP